MSTVYLKDPSDPSFADDAGIKFNVYTEDIKYTIPGPALWKSAAAKLRRHVRDFTGRYDVDVELTIDGKPERVVLENCRTTEGEGCEITLRRITPEPR